jgi:hypothetical protein
MDEQSLSTKRRLKRLENLVGGAGGAGGGLVRLSREWFIDGGTGQTGNTGSIAEPFSTIAKWTTAMGAPANTADANQPLVGYLTPSENGYTEATVYPAGRNVLLMFEPIDPVLGTITGNATWANTTVVNPPALAQIEERNILRVGDFTVTDDGTAATGFVVLSSNNLAGGSGMTGTFDSSACTRFGGLILFNTSVFSLHLGSAATSGVIGAVGAAFQTGTVTAFSLAALGCSISSTAITLHNSATFTNCTFGIGVAPLLTTGTGTANANIFDGPSWRSFLSSGGTRAAGVIVLVVGGFYAGPVYGAALPTDNGAGGAATTLVSLNGNGATAGFTGSGSGNVYVQNGATQNNTVQVLTGGGESVDDTICITKTDLAAHTLTIKNNANTTIATLPSGGRGSVVLVKAGATAIGGVTNDWALSNCGSLAA